jgi:hypothetical protein
VMVEGNEERDFTNGKATELMGRLKAQGALVVNNVDEAVRAVARAGE